MFNVNKHIGNRTAFAVGCTSALGWYIGTYAMLAGATGGVVPAVGAVALAAGLPLWLTRREGAHTPADGAATPPTGSQIDHALNELTDDIWILDADTRQFDYMNHAALGRLGWHAEDLAHRTLDDLDAGEGVVVIRAACDRLQDRAEAVERVETTLFGTPLDATIKRISRTGEPDKCLILLTDISERIEAERTKSDFIAMVSHELRSPLTSIKGSMGLLLSNAAGELPDKAKALLEIAHRNADRLVLIINDILDLEKISAGRMEFEREITDTSALVQETHEANLMLYQRFGVEVDVTGTTAPLMVDTDPNRIIQVLNNFISNACKFSKPGGKVHLSLEDEGAHVRVAVRDEGAGIPAADHHKIFQRFADLTNSDRAGKGGTGLGLSICKAIVESLGGTIGFDSVEGQGTTFYFVLPKATAEELRRAGHADLRAAS